MNNRKYKMKIRGIIFLLIAIFIMIVISGCLNSTGSDISSKIAASENSGTFSEKAYPMGYGPCRNLLKTYEAVYNNGDKLNINWDTSGNPPCDNKFFGITYNVKNSNSNDRFRNSETYSYQIVWATNGPTYSGPSGQIIWTTDGRVDPSSSKGDINEANEFIKIGNEKANEIIRRYESGQLK